MAGDAFGLVGQVIDAQLRVDEAVGEGGFSVVYRGHHLGLDEPVAIKCLKLSSAIDSSLVDSFIRRFRDESRICYRLSRGHLDIVRSITSGTTRARSGALLPYMALEWLEGRSLADELRERRTKKMSGRPLEEVVAFLEPAASAIAYAHAEGVVHRDLKPGNLFVCTTKEGLRLKVLDFGLAKILHDDVLDAVPLKTGRDLLLFSPSYGAPEQLDPRLGAIGPWTDVYALAVVMLEVMRDKKVRSIDAVGNAVVQALDPKDRPTPRRYGVLVGEQVEAVMARAVSLQPLHRQKDVGVFWRELEEAMRRDGATSLAKTAETEVPAVVYAARVTAPTDLALTTRDGAPAFAPPVEDPGRTMRMGDVRRPADTAPDPSALDAVDMLLEDAGAAAGTGTLVMERPELPRRAPSRSPSSASSPSSAPPRSSRSLRSAWSEVPEPRDPPSPRGPEERALPPIVVPIATPIAMSTPAKALVEKPVRGSRASIILLLAVLAALAVAAFLAQRAGLLGARFGR